LQKRLIQEIRDDYSPGKNTARTLEALAPSVKTLAEDLYAKNTHFIFELIQNAEDNVYLSELPLLRFILTKTKSNRDGESFVLLVENNETGFQKEHVEAICKVGISTKTKKQGYIGEKGIGFKSVFRVSSNPHIYSNGYKFSLPEKNDFSPLGYIVPTWVESTPKGLNKDYTSIYLPLDKPDFPPQKVAESLKGISPETILFLKKLQTIELSISLEEQYEIIIEKDDSKFPLVKLTCIEKYAENENVITKQLFWVSSKEFDKPDNVHHEKRSNIKTREVSIAIPLGGKQQGKLFAYLPVWENTGLPFLINADFLLTSSREAVKEDESWNTWLRKCIPDVYIEALISCLSSDRISFEQKITSYASLPHRTNHRFLKSIIPEIRGKLKKKACIFTTHCDELAVPKTTRIASKEFWGLIGDDDLPDTLKKMKQLVCPELEAYSKNLRAIGASSLKKKDLLAYLENEHWLTQKTDKWLLQLYRYLKKYEFDIDILITKKIVRIWSGEKQTNILSCNEDQPIYVEHDDESRKIIKDVPDWLRKRVPVAFLDKDFLGYLYDQEDTTELREWMEVHLNIYPFSKTNFCIDVLSVLQEKYESLSPEKLATATSFLVAHTDDEFDDYWEKIPVVLNTSEKDILSEFSDKKLVVPERYDRDAGWQHIWVTDSDRQHFVALSNHYQPATIEHLLSHCRHIIKKFPHPEKVEKIYSSAANIYERNCIINCRRQSTNGKRISNWRPPSTLRPETIKNKKTSNSLLKFLSENDLLVYKTAHIYYFYYKGYYSQVDSEFYLRIQNCKWLPTQKGFVCPAQAFLPKKEIKEILGDTVPYFQGDLHEKVIELLGIKSELTIDGLLKTLTDYCSETNVSKEMAYRVYSALDNRTRFGTSDDIVVLFADKELIFVPEKSDEGSWYSLQQVIWEDSGKILGDDFTYLQSHYPKLKDFFINTLGVKEKADPESFAQRWLKLQYDTEKSPQEIRENIESIYRILLPIAKRKQDERPDWWDDFVGDALIFTQNGIFVDSEEVVVPDDGELKKIFSATDTEFVWRPEKDSFSQWSPFYNAFSIPNISESVTTELVNDKAEFTINPTNQFITESTILMLSSWLRERDTKYYKKLFKDGVFQSLYHLQEATTDEAIEILFTLEAGHIHEEIEENYPVYWDHQNRILRINTQGKKPEIKRRISTEIAKGVTSNRAYKDLSNRIELTLGAENTDRIQDEGWSIPREIKKIFKTNTQQPDDKVSKGEESSRKDNKASNPEGKINNLIFKESEHQSKDNSQKKSSGKSNASNTNERKQEKILVDEKREENSVDNSQFDIGSDKKDTDLVANHENEDIQTESNQNDDILEKFEQAFNRDGETSLSEEYEDDDYYYDGTVKNSPRRRERSKAGHRERVKNEPNQEERRKKTTRTILEPADPATRSYLLNLYTGKCQICESTFAQRNGSPFFIVGHIIERKNARLLDNPANTLCLCPQHFAQWRHGKVEAVDIIGQILSKKTKSEGAVDDLSLKISLCGKDCEIRYKEKHIVDLQAFLNVLASNDLDCK